MHENNTSQMDTEEKGTSAGSAESEIVRQKKYMYYISNNINTLLGQHKLTQKALADKLQIAESTLSDYKNEERKSLPPLTFFLGLKSAYGISIDDFVSRKITPSDLSTSTYEQNELADYKKYAGTYYVYYFDTSKYKGRDYNTADESLMFGLLYIYNSSSSENLLDYNCAAILGINSQEKVYELKNKFDTNDVPEQDIIAYIQTNHDKNAYYGHFEMTKSHVFLSMTHSNKDRALAIFHRPHGNKERYNGGIGTINSISRGRESMPVVQFIGISRNKIELSNEEIHRALLLNYPNFKSKNEAKELINTIRNLYLYPDSGFHALTEFQKEITLTADLERFVRKSLENNMFRYSKISNRDDDEWYHTIAKNNHDENS